jgi:hypothetical protein
MEARMKPLFLVVLVGATSLLAYLTGTRRLGLSGHSLRLALARMLECVGVMVVFFAANLGLGMILILSFRTLTPGFAPLYLANDISLLVFSFLQSLTFTLWWKTQPVNTGGR